MLEHAQRFCATANRCMRGSGSRIRITQRRLQQVAKEGPSHTSYGGALGQKLVARIKELGGFVTLEDLKNNAPNWVTPISINFKGYRIWEMPPNNQGVIALEMLRILDGYDLKSMGLNSPAVPARDDRSEETFVRRSREVRRRCGSPHAQARADVVGRVHQGTSQSHRHEESANFC